MRSKLQNWQQEAGNDKGTKIVLFLISPFVSFLYSLKTINRKSSCWIVFLFCLCFGLCFTVDNIRLEGSGDGITYRTEFEQIVSESTATYMVGLADFLSFTGQTKDYYFETISFLVSRVTDNYHIMFLVVALIFAFFQIKSIEFLVRDEYFKITFPCMMLLLLFSWNQIFNINGLRFWTAAWVAVYSVLQIYRNDNKRYYLLALFTPFIHGTYYIFLGVLLVAFLFQKLDKVWVLLFIASFFVSNIVVDLLQYASDYVPSFLQSSVDFYTDENYMYERTHVTGTGFYMVDKVFTFVSKLFINLMTLMLVLKHKQEDVTSEDENFYRFTLVYMTIVNFLYVIPSVGNRFIVLGYAFLALCWLRYFKGVKYNFWLMAFPVAFFMNIYHLIVNYWGVTGLGFYVSSPILMLFNHL